MTLAVAAKARDTVDVTLAVAAKARDTVDVTLAVAAKARDKAPVTTILATNELGLRFGHVAHIAPLARGLKRRGVDTAVAVRDVITAAEVEDRPFAAILQSPLLLRPVPRTPTLTWAQVIADGGMADPDHATALVAAWLQLFAGVQPDGIVVEFAPLSMLAAHIAGLRSVRIGTGWTVPPAVAPLPSLTPWLADDAAARGAAQAVADAVVDTVCRRFGAPRLSLAELLAAVPRFLLTWPEFDHLGVFPAGKYYGPLTGLATTARVAWPPGEGPRMFVYMPGNHLGAKPLVEALRALGWPTIWHGDSPPSAALPASVRFSAAAIDTAELFRSAQLMAGRGGHGTGCEALRGGCPQLIIPDTLETSLLGWRLAGQQLARLLPEAPDVAAVTQALVDLATDPAIAAATARAAARYAAYDPARAEDELASDIVAALQL